MKNVKIMKIKMETTYKKHFIKNDKIVFFINNKHINFRAHFIQIIRSQVLQSGTGLSYLNIEEIIDISG